MTPLNIKTEKIIDYKQKRQRLQAEKVPKKKLILRDFYIVSTGN